MITDSLTGISSIHDVIFMACRHFYETFVDCDFYIFWHFTICL